MRFFFDPLPKGKFCRRVFSIFVGGAIFLILIGSEFGQLIEYYYTAPIDLEECRYNSYGCKEAAQYLSHAPDIKDCNISSDSSMEPLDVYMEYELYKKINIKEKKYRYGDTKKDSYYIIWAPETHPTNYRNGEFSQFYSYFKEGHSEEGALKTIFYPNGFPAVCIYKIKNIAD